MIRTSAPVQQNRMPEAPAVLTEGLSVRLGKTQVLDGVDLRVDRGDLYGLLGRNGAGKTTSMRAFLGLLPQSKGRCEIFGERAQRLHHCPEAIAVALDPPGLDDTLTVRQNLELARIRGGIQEGRSVDEALDLVGLSHRAHHRGDRLSHGQGRRAAVARSLLGNPRLLVLDEPLSGLDPEGVEVLIELFRRLTADEGVTVVLSSHHLREVEAVCTRVGMIESGKTVLEGEVEGLLAAAGDRLRAVCSNGSKAEAVLKTVAGVGDIERRSENGLEVVRARFATGVAPAKILEQLVQSECGVEEFVRERASLVDVFQAAVRQESKEAVA